MSLTILDLGKLAIAALMSNRLRMLLTGTGVFLGVAAASTTLQVQRITEAQIQARLAQREAPHVQAGVWLRSHIDDLKEIQRQFPERVQSVSGTMRVWGREVVWRDRRRPAQGLAVSEQYFATTGRRILPGQGRPLLAADFAQYRNTVVIDGILAEQLFGVQSPLEQVFYLQGAPYRVVGVMEAKLDESSETAEEPRGQFVLPLSTQMALTGRHDPNWILVRPHDLADLAALQTDLKAWIQQRYPDYTQAPWAELNWPRMSTNIEDIQASQTTLRTATRSLLLVGAIALGIAGVGIANITVASTLERTREIGLRRAIGATARDVLAQFLLESVLISLLGGLGAIVMVETTTWLLTQQTDFGLPAYAFSHRNAGFSLGAAIAVGLCASLTPALRASRLDPVQALRS
ncbi:MAG: ABC transporter permease [Cyanobacteria bacterium P01_G01_bin.54]